MYKVLLGGFIIGAMAVGCSSSSTCQTKSYNEGDHTRTVCSSAKGVSFHAQTRKQGSISYTTNVDGDISLTARDNKGNRVSAFIEDCVNLHTGLHAPDLDGLCQEAQDFIANNK